MASQIHSSLSNYSNNMRTSTMRSGSMQPSSQQVSTTSLLAQANTSFSSGHAYPLESSTSLVVNTWNSESIVDEELGKKAWEHARRRAEDACIILASLHHSTPTLLQPFCATLPLSIPSSFYTALHALRPFLHCVTPFNPSTPRYPAISASFMLTVEGELHGIALALSTSGIDTDLGLLNVPAEQGYRAFDVFYYLLTSATASEGEALGLKAPNQYALLRKSGTYSPPSYLPTADDAANAEDWRESLRALGIKGGDYRNLLSIVASILRLGDAIGYLVDQDELETTCEEVGSLLEIDPEVLLRKCVTEEREILIAGLYEALVDWIVAKCNEAIRLELRAGQQTRSARSSDIDVHNPPADATDDAVSASITIVDVPSQILGKAVCLRTVFDDSVGINAEMREDGVQFLSAGSSVLREMQEASSQSEADLDIVGGQQARERENWLDRRQTALDKVAAEANSTSFLSKILYPIPGTGISLGKTGRFRLRNTIESSRVWFHLCLHPTDEAPVTLSQQSFPWSAGSVSSQIRSWRLPEWANYRNRQLDFTADFEVDEFANRYSPLGCQAGKEGVEAWAMERGWSNGEVVIGHERVWVREAAWWSAESMLDMKAMDESVVNPSGTLRRNPFASQPFDGSTLAENLTSTPPSRMGTRSIAPTAALTLAGGDYGLGRKGDYHSSDMLFEDGLDPQLLEGKEIAVQRTTFGRRVWVALVWTLTWWVPSFALAQIGRMKRPDVRLAWREKLVLFVGIIFLNCAIVFYIVEFGNLLCPNWDKVWNVQQVGYHDGQSDYWVAHMGSVYDLTHFWRLQHSDTAIQTTQSNMLPLAGVDMTPYIQPPLFEACPGLVNSKYLTLTNNGSILYPLAQHVSGPLTPYRSSVLSQDRWYFDTFQPKISQYYKGELVTSKDKIYSQGQHNNYYWFILDDKIYDLNLYFYNLNLFNPSPLYNFFGDQVKDIVQANPGLDITEKWQAQLNATFQAKALECLNNAFYIGKVDFRDTPRCQVNNYILLGFTIILCVVILTKFLAALQLGSKRRPAQQDKFVICQVPAYTEGEDSLRKGLDSLTALAYDNKRKLICVICDGMIVGSGNDRPTPKIVLDILGVDPKVDPPALPFKSVGQGSEQLNYGKIYSGLYEYEGNVVPYLVIVKVGKDSEQAKSKPGNRGKRDSQNLLMSFLNRVHHRAPMNPLELEMFHQINNVIGVDPELYEYLFMVDADTKVKEDSLNRLVSACANDGKIAGICGETSLENEERSWWTMIQVYEYYISHHLAKAFESLFGSVTCLPGCFCMYRLRTADKGRPLIISDKVVQEYADINIDTLHKKNLLSLGEDRYLTTLMTKHFPQMSYKFLPDAYALTEAPSKWSVLLSQRRRWINSTIHNLAELVWLKDLCGFCCFSMRFVVFIDLFGTIILPATCGYLVYLIYRVASHTGQFPLISIIMLSAVYGLQALIFIVKRQWQHIGWMIIYILAYPIWSLVLPLYSFWKQDDFSWGTTRVVIGERGDKKIVAEADAGFDPRSIPLQRWDDYAQAHALPGSRAIMQEKSPAGVYYQDVGYEMDDMHSVYSAVKPASTMLTGFPQMQMYQPPYSPSPMGGLYQQPGHGSFSILPGAARYSDSPNPAEHARTMSMSMANYGEPYTAHSRHQSRDHLLFSHSPVYQDNRSPSPYNHSRFSRPGSVHLAASRLSTFSGFQTPGPSDEAITHAIRECLNEVDLDNATKKQLKALAEQKLQCQLVGERKAYLDARIDEILATM